MLTALEPLVRTLLEGFKHFEVPVAYVIVEAFKCRGQCMRGHFHRVRRGEMLIWVGNPGRVEVPWRYLRDKGVYSVYYQSEPRTGGRDAPCHLNASVVDERKFNEAKLATHLFNMTISAPTALIFRLCDRLMRTFCLSPWKAL